MKALVTGASGLIGSHLCEALGAAGYRVRGTVRDAAKPGALGEFSGDMEIVQARLEDIASLEAACRGVDVVFHCASNVKLWVRRKSESITMNETGTAHVLEAAKLARVKRFIHVSTCAVIKRSPLGSPLPNEQTPTTRENLIGIYERTKFMAERMAFAANGHGMDVLIASPTAPVGARDVNLTPLGKLIRAFLRGEIKSFTDTGLNVVDVRDVALGLILIAQKGRAGEKYILGGENLHQIELLNMLSELTGQPAPTRRISYRRAQSRAIMGEVRALFTGREPEASWAAARSAKYPHWFSSDKARQELGYKPRPIAEALALAIDWFRENDSGADAGSQQSSGLLGKRALRAAGR